MKIGQTLLILAGSRCVINVEPMCTWIQTLILFNSLNKPPDPQDIHCNPRNNIEIASKTDCKSLSHITAVLG